MIEDVIGVVVEEPWSVTCCNVGVPPPAAAIDWDTFSMPVIDNTPFTVVLPKLAG